MPSQSSTSWPSTYSLVERIDVVQLAGFDQRSDDGAVLGAAVGACEERIFPFEDDRTDGAFEGAVVELDTAVIKEARQSLPARERIADGVGEPALLTDQTKLCRSYSWNASASSRPLCCRMRRRSSALWPRMSFSMAKNSAMSSIRECPLLMLWAAAPAPARAMNAGADRTFGNRGARRFANIEPIQHGIVFDGGILGS